MPPSATQGRAYCLKCGREAQLVTTTMDPARPIVSCAWATGMGEPRGCGRQLGGYDQDDIKLVIRSRQLDALVQLHKQGRHYAKHAAGCPRCEVPTASAAAKPHDYEPIRAKLALVRHLVGPHAYGELSELVIYSPLVELTSTHERLHQSATLAAGERP